jgi:hypothetical protein
MTANTIGLRRHHVVAALTLLAEGDEPTDALDGLLYPPWYPDWFRGWIRDVATLAAGPCLDEWVESGGATMPPDLRDIRELHVAEEYASGKGTEDLCARYGIGYYELTAAIQGWGAEMRPVGRPPGTYRPRGKK